MLSLTALTGCDTMSSMATQTAAMSTSVATSLFAGEAHCVGVTTRGTLPRNVVIRYGDDAPWQEATPEPGATAPRVLKQRGLPSFLHVAWSDNAGVQREVAVPIEFLLKDITEKTALLVRIDGIQIQVGAASSCEAMPKVYQPVFEQIVRYGTSVEKP